MAMKKCGACGNDARVTRLATVVGDGPARRAHVCSACAKRGVFIVPVTRAVVNDTSKAERAEQRETLEPFIQRIEGLAAGYALKHGGPSGTAADGVRAEAYEAIAHMLKEGRA